MFGFWTPDVIADGSIDQLRDIANRHSPDLVMCNYQIWRPDVVINSRKHKKELQVTTFGGYTISGAFNT